jgi:hypothetical protein
MEEEEEAEGRHGAPLTPGAVATGLGKAREGAKREETFFLCDVYIWSAGSGGRNRGR